MRVYQKSKSSYIKHTCSMLKDFGIKVDKDIIEHIDSLYPNEIAIERYTRKLILKKLED